MLRTINSTDPDTAYLVVADQNGKQQTIVSDSKHPYFAQYGTDPTPPQPSPGKPYHGDIANAYWVNAANLEAGHKLIDDSGNWQTVVSVRVEPKPLNSYNLEVENDHTFFIRGLGGDAGIWVHNTDCWRRIPYNASVSYVDGQLVRTFVHEGRIVKVTPNPSWNPAPKGAIGYQYVEVIEKNGKLYKVNDGKPDIIFDPNQPPKNAQGLFVENPYKSKYSDNYDYSWIAKNQTGAKASYFEKNNAQKIEQFSHDYSILGKGYDINKPIKFEDANLRTDLIALRDAIGRIEGDTIAVARTNIKGLDDMLFVGGSPSMLKNAKSDFIYKASPNSPVYTPPNLQFRAHDHAEQVVINNFIHAVEKRGLKNDEVNGILEIHQSNSAGVCPNCIQGIENPNVSPGVFKQLSDRYPNLTIKVSSASDPKKKIIGRDNFILKNGKYIK